MMVSMRLLAAAACGFACAFATVGSALAHIGVTPGFVVADETQSLSVNVHNDIDQPMTGLTVMAPDGIRIVAAGTEGAWQGEVEGRTATWSGGPLAPNTGAMFALDVVAEAAAMPGPVQLQAEQIYPGGGSLPWPIPLTVIPSEEKSQLLTWAVVGVVAALATGGIALLAVRRRGRSLQER